MLLASDALSKFDGSTAPPTSSAQQPPPPAHQPSVEAHPPPAPPPAAQARETAPPVVPSHPAAATVTPVAESRAKETPPQGGSTQGEEEETEGLEAVATATTNLNSAKAEAKLVKALDYLVAINDHSDNTGQKWFINESILASLTGCFRPAIKKFAETHRSFISQANNTHGLGPGHNRGKARTSPDAIPLLVNNFKRDALGQPF
jgi:hypothetical protein